MIKIPGFIDIHVHLRDPGEIHKEDFYSGTTAAVAGGYTTVLDMPNNKIPITTLKTLKEKIKIAKKKIFCDVGFYAGSLGLNLEELMKMEPYVFGLKLYMNVTTGNYIIDNYKLEKILSAWMSKKPIMVHAESDVIENVIFLANKYKRWIHVCHVSTKHELKTVIKYKNKGFKVTCGVTPHHLFLGVNDVKKLGPFAMMKPQLKKGCREFLWKNLFYIDVIESDHAPHTVKEKKSKKFPFGVPNLETTLPLLLTAVSKKKLSMDRLIELCYKNPKKLFNIPTDDNTYVEIDEKEEYIINNKKLFTKCGWSPFNGWKVKGKVKRVYIRGQKVFDNDKLLVQSGKGKYVVPALLRSQ